MRDLAVARLAAAAAAPHSKEPATFLLHNGGIPPGTPAHVIARDEQGHEVPFPDSPAAAERFSDRKLFVTFDSEPGLTIPALLWLPRAAPRGVAVLIADGGKADAEARFSIEKLRLGGFACFALDPRGIGELDGIDLRLLIYRNCAPAFAAAIDVERALQLVRPLASRIALITDGPATSLTAVALGLGRPELDALLSRNALRDFGEIFDESVSLLALQPQADLLPPLSALRAALEPPSKVAYRGEGSFDYYATLLRLLRM